MSGDVRVVLVDDERLILDLLHAAFEDGGYAVEIAAGCEEALAALAVDATGRQALVTDINIAGDPLTGWDLAHKAREIDPQIPIVYMTGAAGAEWSANGVPNSILLIKPFAPAQAVTAVSQLLNSQPGPSNNSSI